MIHNYNLIKAIASEAWYISLPEAERLIFLVSSVLSPNIAFEPKDKASVASIRTFANSESENKKSQNVGIVNITGALTKYDQLCSYGMQSYGSIIKGLEANSNISSIVLCIDSGGGTVAGTEELGVIIKNCSKPVVAFISDMACSAAYWIASCCQEIVANSTTAEVGSIGVLCTYVDVSGYYEKNGIKVHNIYAPESKDKQEDSKAIEKGDYKITEAKLSVLASKFHSIVKENRSNIEESQLTGKVYYAKDVIGSLVDSIGSIDDAISLAADLSTNQSNISMSKQNYPALAKVADVASFETDDGSISLNAEQAQTIDAALTATESTSNDLAQRTTELSTANAQIATLQSDLNTANAKISELEGKDGDKGAGVAPESDSTQSSSASDNTLEGFHKAFESAKQYV